MPVETLKHRATAPESNHRVHSLVYADETERLAAELGADDVGRDARQLDTGDFYRLVSEPNVWMLLGTSPQTTSTVSNDSTVPGASTTEALDALLGLDAAQQASIDTLTSGAATLSALAVARVADVASLVGLPITTAGAYVESVRDWFVYRAASTATLDYVTAADSSHGAGRWERWCLPHPSWALQASIYMNATTGNDEWDGSAAAAGGGLVGPIKTTAELVRRLGLIYRPTILQRVYAVGDFTAAFSWHVIGGAGRVIIIGSFTVQYSGLIGAVTNLNVATNQDPKMQGNPAWVPATENKRILRTFESITGVDGACVGYMQEASGGANGESYITPPLTVGINVANTSPAQPAWPAVGTAITTSTWATHFRAVYLTCEGEEAFNIHDCHLGINVASRVTALNCPVLYSRCWVENAGATLGLAGGTHKFNGCLVDMGTDWTMAANDMAARIYFTGGLVLGSVFAVTSGLHLSLRSDVTISNAGGLGIFGQLSRLYADTVRFRNVAGTAPFFTLAGHANARTTGRLYGNNTTTGPVAAMGRGTRYNITASIITGYIPVRGGGVDFTFNAQTQAPGFDRAAVPPAFVSLRNLTIANLSATIAGGGFAGCAFDPSADCAIALI